MKLRFQVSSFRSPSSAFTLLELLLALVISALIVGLVLSIYRTTAGAVQGQKDRDRGGPAAERALEQLRGDVACAFLPDDDDRCAFCLSSSNASAVISFCSILPVDGEVDSKWSRTFHVVYRMEQGGRLVRVVEPAAGPGSLGGAVTNVVVEDIDQFKVALYDGTDWQEKWPPEDAHAKPRAARAEIVSARFKGKPSWKAEIFIPAGNVVTSSVVRTTGRVQ